MRISDIEKLRNEIENDAKLTEKAIEKFEDTKKKYKLSNIKYCFKNFQERKSENINDISESSENVSSFEIETSSEEIEQEKLRQAIILEEKTIEENIKRKEIEYQEQMEAKKLEEKLDADKINKIEGSTKEKEKVGIFKKISKRATLIGLSVLSLFGVGKLMLNSPEDKNIKANEEHDIDDVDFKATKVLKEDKFEYTPLKEKTNTFSTDLEKDVVSIGNYNYSFDNKDYKKIDENKHTEAVAISDQKLEEIIQANNNEATDANIAKNENDFEPAKAPEVSNEEIENNEKVNKPEIIEINSNDGSSTVNPPTDVKPDQPGIGENVNNVPTGTGGAIDVIVKPDELPELPPLEAPEYVAPVEQNEQKNENISNYSESEKTTVEEQEIKIVIEDNDKSDDFSR